MENLTVALAVEHLKLELDACGVSLREVEKRVDRSIRHKLSEGKQDLLTLQDILDILDAAGIDRKRFFARLIGLDGPLPFSLLKPRQKAEWTKGQQRILAILESMTAAGSRGCETVRERLGILESQYEDQPDKAEAAAWKLLASCREPGAAVDVLAAIATFSSPNRAFPLLTLAIEILGPQIECALGGRLLCAVGRYYTKAEFPRDAIAILKTQALPRVTLFGTPDEQALVFFHIGMAAAAIDVDHLHAAALKKAASVGGIRMRFAAMQLLAYQRMNVGDVVSAAEMYDEVVSLPYFEQAGRRARAYVKWSRFTAHLLAGRLGPGDEAAFRAAVAEARALMDARDQVAASLDLVVYLESIGKSAAARHWLETDLWMAVDLVDPELQQKYVRLWNLLGLPEDARFATLINRREPTPLRTHPRG